MQTEPESLQLIISTWNFIRFPPLSLANKSQRLHWNCNFNQVILILILICNFNFPCKSTFFTMEWMHCFKAFTYITETALSCLLKYLSAFLSAVSKVFLVICGIIFSCSNVIRWCDGKNVCQIQSWSWFVAFLCMYLLAGVV